MGRSNGGGNDGTEGHNENDHEEQTRMTHRIPRLGLLPLPALAIGHGQGDVKDNWETA